jgi:murein DD-endopeptidase MepM/ murein hydrolase activator NlpD
MKRLLVLVAAGVLLVATGATAGSYGLPDGFPSADTPNASGSIEVPAGWTATASRPYTLTPDELQSVWQGAGNAYGIPWQVLAAINKIESNFGRNMGPSSAGAIGWMQFMPSTWLRWGLDADKDGIADPWDPYDAIYAAARYLAATGGETDIRAAIFSYNHADWYVREVLQVATMYGSGGQELTFNLDRAQVSLDRAAKALARANGNLVAARHREALLQRKADRLKLRARTAAALSDRADLARLAVLAQQVADAQAVTVSSLADDVSAARQQLAQARDAAAQAAGASTQARTLLGAPTSGGNYVFPVGGGPDVVSVSHTHHDYPAADIAAPEGAPEFALEAGTVINAWTGIDARCGIGFTFRGEDGQTWTYCHMSYREPSVVDGAQLTAGQPVGLVGSTGHATGPHLHLQLQPASAWPQEEDWFAGFAGTAFRWQDAPTPGLDLGDGAGAGTGPTFVIEGDTSANGSFAVVPPTDDEPQNEASVLPSSPPVTSGPFGVLR